MVVRLLCFSWWWFVCSIVVVIVDCHIVLNLWQEVDSVPDSVYVSSTTGNLLCRQLAHAPYGYNQLLLVGSRSIRLNSSCVFLTFSGDSMYVMCESLYHHWGDEMYGDKIKYVGATFDICVPQFGNAELSADGTLYISCVTSEGVGDPMLLRIRNDSSRVEILLYSTRSYLSVESIGASSFHHDLPVYATLFTNDVINGTLATQLVQISSNATIIPIPFPHCNAIRVMYGRAKSAYVKCLQYVVAVDSESQKLVYTLSGSSTYFTNIQTSLFNDTLFIATENRILSVDTNTLNRTQLTPPGFCPSSYSMSVNQRTGMLVIACSLGLIAIADDTIDVITSADTPYCDGYVDLAVVNDTTLFAMCTTKPIVVRSMPQGGAFVYDVSSLCLLAQAMSVGEGVIYVACNTRSSRMSIVAVNVVSSETRVAAVLKGCVAITDLVYSKKYKLLYASCAGVGYHVLAIMLNGTYARLPIAPPTFNLVSIVCNERTGEVYASGYSYLARVRGLHVDVLINSGNADIQHLAFSSHHELFAVIEVSPRTVIGKLVNESKFETNVSLGFRCDVFGLAFMNDQLVAICTSVVVPVYDSIEHTFGDSLLSPHHCFSPSGVVGSSNKVYIGCANGLVSVDPSCGNAPGWAVQQGECQLCGPGTARPYSSTFSNLQCEKCSPGKVSSTFGSGECTPCKEGEYGSSNVVCFPCAAGRFMNRTEATSCDACPRGRFSNRSRSIECEKCAVGSYTTSDGNMQCVPCIPGFYSNSSHTECKPCEAGRYSQSAGSTSCSGPCDAGFSCPRGSTNSRQLPCGSRAVYCSDGIPLLVGSGHYATNCTSNSTCASQTICERGFYCSVGIRKPCAPGSYSASVGAVKCELCPAGKYNNLWRQTWCRPCGVMEGQPLTGQLSCERCPKNYYSPPSIGQCEECLPPLAIQNHTVCTTFSCNKGEFFENSACHLCPPGKYSSAAGATLSCSIAPPNTYAPKNGTVVPYSCDALDGVVCFGGRAYAEVGYWVYEVDPVLGTVAATRCLPGRCGGSAEYDGDQCIGHRKQGAENVLCGECATGFTETQGSFGCVSCKSTNIVMVMVVILLAFVAVVLLHVLSHQDKRGATISVTVYFIQICVVMVGVHSASVGWLSIFNFTTTSPAPGACIVPLSARQLVIVELVEPWTLFLVLCTIMVCHFLCQRGKRCYDATRQVSARSFALLSGNGDETAVNESLWAPHDVWHYVCVSPFKAHAWWYSAFVLLRRALISVCDVFLVLQPRDKYISFGLLHVLFLLIHLHVRPYHYERDNRIETVSQSLLIVLACCLSTRPPPLKANMYFVVLFVATIPSFMLLVYIIGQKHWFSSGRQTPSRGSVSSLLVNIWQQLGAFRPVTYYQTAVSMVLFSYTRLLTVSLRLLYCVDVGSRWRVLYFSPALSCSSRWYKNIRIYVCVLLVYLCCLPLAVIVIAYNRRRSGYQTSASLLKWMNEVDEPSISDSSSVSSMFGLEVEQQG